MDFISQNGRDWFGGSCIDWSNAIMFPFDVKIKGRVGFISSLTSSTYVIAFSHFGISGLLFNFDTSFLERFHLCILYFLLKQKKVFILFLKKQNRGYCFWKGD